MIILISSVILTLGIIMLLVGFILKSSYYSHGFKFIGLSCIASSLILGFMVLGNALCSSMEIIPYNSTQFECSKIKNICVTVCVIETKKTYEMRDAYNYNASDTAKIFYISIDKNSYGAVININTKWGFNPKNLTGGN